MYKLIALVLVLSIAPAQAVEESECSKIERVYQALIAACKNPKITPSDKRAECIAKIDKLHEEYLIKGNCSRPNVS